MQTRCNPPTQALVPGEAVSRVAVTREAGKREAVETLTSSRSTAAQRKRGLTSPGAAGQVTFGSRRLTVTVN